MAKIQKGMALSTAVIGVFCIIFGVAVSICAWVLSGKISSDFTVHQSGDNTGSISFGTYWWGGITFVVPGILGVIAGCTRNVVVMILFLIFNLLCLISSLAVSVLAALVIAVWSSVNIKLQEGDCHDWLGDCICGTDYKLVGATCSTLKEIQTILGAMIAMASISSLLSFIASYISCCSLCNQEHDTTTVIIQHGAGAYQPPQTVVLHTGQMPQPYFGQHPQQPYFGQHPQQPYYGQQPQQPYFGQHPQQPYFGQHPQQPYYGQQPQNLTTNDKVKLVDSQVI